MASSPVDIANLALGHVDGGFITNLNSSSPGASRIRVYYDTARKVELEAFNWSFARKVAELEASDDDDAVDGFQYAFSLPPDFLVARGLANASATAFGAVPFFNADGDFSGIQATATKNKPPYAIYGDLIMTGVAGTEENDEGDTVINLIYTFDNTAVADYTSNFVMALSHRLASYIAADPGAKEMQTLLADRHRLLAQGTDGNTGFSPRPEPDATWIAVR